MRGARERTAFQYKNKKFQQAYMQELSLKNSNNVSLAMSGGGSGSPSAFLGGQQIAISYCNINNVPPPKEIVDIPDYNALIELQNQLKREQLKNEERQRLLNNDGNSFTQKNNEF